MPKAHLEDRRLIRISGPDAESFLQNLITTDIAGLGAAEARPGALLTPQGKIMFDFMIFRTGDGFMIETDATQVETLLRRLMMYKLRANVTLAAEDNDGVTVVWGEDAPEGAVADSRFVTAGTPLYRLPGKLCDGDSQAFEVLRIGHGITVSGKDFALQDAFPHDVLMDRNGGLSFKKGCYVGQEVVSRMQHRGTARRRPAIVTAESGSLSPDTPLTAAGKPVGTIGSVSGSSAIAIVRIDRVGVALAAGTPILAGDTPVTLALPQWSGLSFPTDAADEADA
ncbi:YgfZ/GcvT domain-containing protein [Rhizobium sp. NRK18]|uniref:CAF17-like 4Fe-4S cluster assembly/insertion protein YgfZ n=1 Tax=Rhizobium sp. NRK18 TaxID=2964667 RepID=UPI0021C28A05|nr:folate-binding protein YgfZ [Rhizobium sp. NRK18]MCQ2004759.1 folate-binding protein YgfZ [Rhizobium sp. NRK18]